jgi:hypothetical protein
MGGSISLLYIVGILSRHPESTLPGQDFDGDADAHCLVRKEVNA